MDSYGRQRPRGLQEFPDIREWGMIQAACHAVLRVKNQFLVQAGEGGSGRQGRAEDPAAASQLHVRLERRGGGGAGKDCCPHPRPEAEGGSHTSRPAIG